MRTFKVSPLFLVPAFLLLMIVIGVAFPLRTPEPTAQPTPTPRTLPTVMLATETTGVGYHFRLSVKPAVEYVKALFFSYGFPLTEDIYLTEKNGMGYADFYAAADGMIIYSPEHAFFKVGMWQRNTVVFDVPLVFGTAVGHLFHNVTYAVVNYTVPEYSQDEAAKWAPVAFWDEIDATAATTADIFGYRVDDVVGLYSPLSYNVAVYSNSDREQTCYTSTVDAERTAAAFEGKSVFPASINITIPNSRMLWIGCWEEDAQGHPTRYEMALISSPFQAGAVEAQ